MLTFKAVFRRKRLDLVFGAVVQDVDRDVRVVQGKHVVPGVGQQHRRLIAHRQEHVDGRCVKTLPLSKDALVLVGIEVLPPHRHAEVFEPKIANRGKQRAGGASDTEDATTGRPPS